MVQGGINRIKVFGFIRANLCDNLSSVEFFFPGFRERFIHVGADNERIGGLPWPRLVFEEFEFNRKILLMLLNEFVYAASVSFHDDARFFVKQRGIAIGGETEAERGGVFMHGTRDPDQEFS